MEQAGFATVPIRTGQDPAAAPGVEVTATNGTSRNPRCFSGCGAMLTRFSRVGRQLPGPAGTSHAQRTDGCYSWTSPVPRPLL